MIQIWQQIARSSLFISNISFFLLGFSFRSEGCAVAQSPAFASELLKQTTSVSKLSDVRPTDWSFQALQSLVERYGCIA